MTGEIRVFAKEAKEAIRYSRLVSFCLPRFEVVDVNHQIKERQYRAMSFPVLQVKLREQSGSNWKRTAYL